MNFNELFNRVFDENKQIKACGREACIDLINFCNQVAPNTDFGNKNTGFMNLSNILAFADNYK